MGVALVPTLSGWAARVGRITMPPDSTDYMGRGCTACVRVCMLFRFTQKVLINIGNSLLQDNALQVKLNVFK